MPLQQNIFTAIRDSVRKNGGKRPNETARKGKRYIEECPFKGKAMKWYQIEWIIEEYFSDLPQREKYKKASTIGRELREAYACFPHLSTDQEHQVGNDLECEKRMSLSTAI